MGESFAAQTQIHEDAACHALNIYTYLNTIEYSTVLGCTTVTPNGSIRHIRHYKHR
jgi:hypothetical protein